MLQAALTGGASFREVSSILADLDFRTATRSLPGAPHTIYDVLWHLEFVQRVLLGEAAGQDANWAEQATWWPSESPNEEEFQRVRRDLQVSLAHAQALAADPSDLARDALMDLATHSAYHWGQVVLLRQLLGDWRPA